MYFIKCISCLMYFITIFPTARHVSVFWPRITQPTATNYISLRAIFISYFYLRPELPSVQFSQGFPPPNPSIFSLLPHTCHMPHPSHYRWFYHPNIWRGVQTMKSHYTVFYSLLLLPPSQAQISSSALNYRTCSVYVVRLVWEITFKKQFSVNRI
jgi:hypothetical protein